MQENGGYVVYQNPRNFCGSRQLKLYFGYYKNNKEIPDARAVLSAKESSYYESDDEGFVEYFSRYYIKNKKKILQKIVDDSVFKIAVYHPIIFHLITCTSFEI